MPPVSDVHTLAFLRGGAAPFPGAEGPWVCRQEGPGYFPLTLLQQQERLSSWWGPGRAEHVGLLSKSEEASGVRQYAAHESAGP